MSKVPDGYVALPFVGSGAEEEVPQFGNVTGLETMAVKVYVRRARAIQEAAALVPYTLRQAADVFGLIYDLADSDRPDTLRSLAELCQRALESVAEKEGNAIADLDVILRSALNHYPKSEADQ